MYHFSTQENPKKYFFLHFPGIYYQTIISMSLICLNLLLNILKYK